MIALAMGCMSLAKLHNRTVNNEKTCLVIMQEFVLPGILSSCISISFACNMDAYRLILTVLYAFIM